MFALLLRDRSFGKLPANNNNNNQFEFRLTLASNLWGSGLGHRNQLTRDNQNHIHSDVLFYGPQGPKTCKKSPKTWHCQQRSVTKPRHVTPYHDKNHHPGKIKGPDDLHCNGGLARARATGNTNNAYVLPWRGVTLLEVGCRRVNWGTRLHSGVQR